MATPLNENKDKKTMNKSLKYGLISVGAIAVLGLGGYGIYSATQGNTPQTVNGKDSTPSVVKALKKTEQSDTIEKSINAKDDKVINRKKEREDETKLSQKEQEKKAAERREATGVVAYAMSDQFAKLAKFESMNEKDAKKIKVDELNELAYWFVWYSQYAQVVSPDGSISTASDGLDRLALVYDKAGQKAPYDVYADGFKITADAKNWDSFKPSNFEKKLEEYRNKFVESNNSETASENPKSSDVTSVE